MDINAVETRNSLTNNKRMSKKPDKSLLSNYKNILEQENSPQTKNTIFFVMTELKDPKLNPDEIHYQF